ncbi:MAG: hypothetical protein AB1461_10370 [Thermodesulfobacteriota bacterium]
MKITFPFYLLLCLALLSLAGCAGYYVVTDPASGRSYYTHDIDDAGDGAISFKDSKSGNEVILDSSEVKEISKEDYHRAVHGAAVSD